MIEPIRGKVARVLNEKELALNIGAANGVTVGMIFDIIEAIQIKDPDTSKRLGKVERSKISLAIIEVQEKLSVASSLDKSMILEDVGPFTSSLLSSNRALVRTGEVVVQSTGSKYIVGEQGKIKDSKRK